MDECYRDYRIRVDGATGWNAVITELATGVVLPTKATARRDEGPIVVLRRARELIDVYLGPGVAGDPARTSGRVNRA